MKDFLRWLWLIAIVRGGVAILIAILIFIIYMVQR